MDDDRVVISSALGFAPETVASRTFNAVFRGYDQTEVRTFLKRVAGEMASAAVRENELRRALQDALSRAAHPELDEGALTNALGEHAARLLTNAREAATAMVSDAETRSARILQEAETKIARVRADADTLLARRTEEAERLTTGLRQAAEADARAVRERARAEAEAEVESARAQGREMVSEARGVRERMLADLTRRQRSAEAHVEQLRSVRERLLEAYAVVRRTVDEATAELGRAESDTRPVVEAAADQLSASGPVPTGHDEQPQFPPEEHAQPRGRPIPTSGPVAAPLQAPAAPSQASPVQPPAPPVFDKAMPDTPMPEKPAPDKPMPAPVMGRKEPQPTPSGRAPLPPFKPAPFPNPPEHSSRAPSPFGGLGSVVPEEERPNPPASAPADPPVTSPPQPSSVAVSEPPPATVPQSPEPSVDELFARMRAGQPVTDAPPAAADVADPGSDAHPPPQTDVSQGVQRVTDTEDGDGAGSAGTSGAGDGQPAKADDESVLYRRDELLDPIDADLARQLKRVLHDEQNEVLDRLRRQRRPVVEATLPDFVSQTERYQVAAAPLLRTAAHRGAGFVAGMTDGPVELEEPPEKAADEWAADLAVEVVIPLRERLEAALNEAAGTPDDAEPDTTIADRLSASYRQWKIHQIEQVARHHATAAFVRGAFAAVPDGVALRWVVDDEGPCPDCDDNALAGPTPKGEAFPTGQTHPPAHQGCRCLVVSV